MSFFGFGNGDSSKVKKATIAARNREKAREKAQNSRMRRMPRNTIVFFFFFNRFRLNSRYNVQVEA